MVNFTVKINKKFHIAWKIQSHIFFLSLHLTIFGSVIERIVLVVVSILWLMVTDGDDSKNWANASSR